MLRELVRRLTVRGALAPATVDGRTPTIAILGAGAGGLCAAIRLCDRGIDSFTIYEKSDGVGGTWRDNTYPGACCDVKSHLYSFSFEPNPEWSRRYAEQPEILEYFEDCAKRHDLYSHIRFGSEVTALRFDEGEACWRLRLATGEEETAQIVISALGQLNRPVIPDFPGLAEFGGTSFHSARWNHDHDLAGERVAVIGNAASALQFVPRIATEAGALDVYQRSANWVLPKPNASFGPVRRWAFHHLPGAVQLHRWSTYWSFELRYLAFRRPSRLAGSIERLARKYLAAQVPDPELREQLVPDYPLGCKRILASDDYLPALTRDNVSLVTTPIERFTSEGIVTADGVTRPTDTVIFATGFDSTHFLAPVEVLGRQGRRLEDQWDEGAEAYLGMTVSGFPNLFMLYGPNTNLGHNSILFMIECQVEYLLRCLDELAMRRASWMDVRREAMERYNRWVREHMQHMVWESGCHSWYKTETGKVVNNWPATTVRYWLDTLEPKIEAYEIR